MVAAARGADLGEVFGALIVLVVGSTLRAALFTCWYSNCDNIVFPASTAALAGADNRFVDGLAHVQMAFDPGVMQACLEEMVRE